MKATFLFKNGKKRSYIFEQKRIVDGNILLVSENSVVTISKDLIAEQLPYEVLEDNSREIYALEAQITPRRIREAVLGVDKGWLADIEKQIEALR